MWRFIEDDSTARRDRSGNLFEKSLSPLLMREKTEKKKIRTWHTCDRKCGSECRRTRYCFDLHLTTRNLRSKTLAHPRDEHRPRIGYPWRPRIRDEGELFSFGEHIENRICLRESTLGMIAQRWRINSVFRKEGTRHSSILTEDSVGFFEHTKSPKGDILKISDRGANDVERGHRYAILYPHPTMNTAKTAIIYVTPDIERALGTVPGQLSIGTGDTCQIIGEYFIIASRSAYAEEIQKQYPDYITLVDVLDTIDILKLPEIKKLISEISAKKDAHLLVFKNSRPIEEFVKENKWHLLNPSADLAEKIENKVTQAEWLGEFASYLPPYQIQEVKDISPGEKFIPFILQWAHSHSGDGTILITSDAQLAELKQKFPARLARTTRFIKGPTFTVNIAVNATITPASTFIGNINYQITGTLPFTDNPWSTIGNDWSVPHTILTEAQLARAEKLATDVAQKMSDSGWRGLFGLDFMYDEERDEIRLIEINARQAAGVTFESILQEANRAQGVSGITMFEAHLLSLLPEALSKNIPEKIIGKIIPLNDGAQIIQRVTATIMKTGKLPDITPLVAAGFTCIQYANTRLNSHILRIQSDRGIMLAHNKFNPRGKEILDAIAK